MTTTTYRRTTITSLTLSATAALLVGLFPPAAHANQTDAGRPTAARPLAGVDEVVAFRKAEQAQYLVDQGLLALR